MDAIAAVILLTLREAVRKRIFILLLLFAVMMVAGAAFFPAVRPQDQVRLVQTWSLRGMILFSVLTAVFLAGGSLPAEYESRRVQVLLTKPLSRWQLFFGKVAGFAIVLAIGLALMGGLSLAYLQWVAWRQGFPLEVRGWIERSEVSGNAGTAQGETHAEPRILLAGPEPAAGSMEAMWTFRGLDPDDFEELVPAILRLEISQGEMRYHGRVELRLPDAPPGATPQPRVLMVRHLAPTEIQIPKSAITPEGVLRVTVRRAPDPELPATRVTAGPAQLVLACRPASYALNFFLGLLLVYAELLVLLSVTVSASTFVSGGVSAFVGLFVFLMGSMYGFVEESLAASDQSMRQQARQESVPLTMRRTDPELPSVLVRLATRVGERVIRVLPDFRRFDFAGPLLRDRAVDRAMMARAWGHAAPFCLVSLALAVVLLRQRQYG